MNTTTTTTTTTNKSILKRIPFYKADSILEYFWVKSKDYPMFSRQYNTIFKTIKVCYFKNQAWEGVRAYNQYTTHDYIIENPDQINILEYFHLIK